MKLIALGNLNRRAQRAQHLIGKVFARVTAISQHARHGLQLALTAFKGHDCTGPVADIGSGNRHSMRQPLGVHREMTLDPGDLLACVVSLAARRVTVLHALCVDDQKAWRGVPLQFHAGRANLIFLTPAPAGSFPLHRPLARS